MQIIIGFAFGILISVAAWRMGSLSTSGALAAAVTGGLIFGLGGLPWAVTLLVFFITSSLLSKTFRHQKTSITEKFEKGSQRDWGQVLANGGFGTLLVLYSTLFSDPVMMWFTYAAFAGAMAAVNADTWATELGVLNPRPPRLITTGKVVEAGTSGAISFYGSMATLVGAAIIGLASAAFSLETMPWSLWFAVTLGGICGSLFDSLLGASIQAIYRCPLCDKDTERHPRHLCGTETVQIRGYRWLNNDMVNFTASIAGGVTTIGILFLLP
jgi:uncharacterized protein (TIGR00297 family)